jgi:hypothetical protein
MLLNEPIPDDLRDALADVLAHRISGSFHIAWRALMAANVQRLLAA